MSDQIYSSRPPDRDGCDTFEVHLPGAGKRWLQQPSRSGNSPRQSSTDDSTFSILDPLNLAELDVLGPIKRLLGL